ncbi:hypothetical protein NDU88_004509 [Pleurodeles waltl]|uniref:Uncharacterized protein n=1 Tax=Pleurodeles waltl TaxID=8319 RepID=A0AAV7N1M2_PLEWA|nr:hypothetical protein NDU88_004509 [Pleurodeles waltl]
MENQGINQDFDLEEIIKAARESASTRSKDWILKQIRGGGTNEVPTQEEHIEDGPRDTDQGRGGATRRVKVAAAECKQRRQKGGQERGK